MRRNEYLIEDRELRAARAQSQDVPVVLVADFAVWDEREQHVAFLAVGTLVGNRCDDAEPVADVASRAIIPFAVEDEAVRDGASLALRRQRDRHAQVAI